LNFLELACIAIIAFLAIIFTYIYSAIMALPFLVIRYKTVDPWGCEVLNERK